MKINELRLSNLVFIDNAKHHPAVKDVPLEVTAITPNLDSSGWTHSISLKHINQKPNTYYETYSQFLKWIKPIPLTEEWLLKFGFEEALNGWWDESELFCYKENALHSGAHFWLADIEFVHQLQNLYFSLTGEELTIKS